MRRLRALLSLAALVAFEGGALVVLLRASTLDRWHVDWANLWRWIDVTPGEDVAAAAIVWIGIVAVTWLSLTTALAVLAALTRAPALVRTANVFSFPFVQRVVQRGLGVAIVAQALLPHGAAFAQPPAAGWVTTPVTASPNPNLGQAVTGMPAAVAPTADAPGEWGVSSGDNLWDIAAATLEHQTGGPVTDAEIAPYWRALMDAASPPSGDVNLIFPDEVYQLPPFASTVDFEAAATDPVAPTPPPSAPEEPTAGGQEASASVEAPVELPVEAPVEEPTTDLFAEPVAAPAVETPAAPAEALVAEEAPVDTATTAAQSTSHLPLFAGGVLAVGLVAALARRRRRTARTLRPGETLVSGTPEHRDTEVALRTTAARSIDNVAFLEMALRALGQRLEGSAAELAPVGVIMAASGEIDIVMAESGVAPAPFRGRGTHWTLDRNPETVAAIEAAAEDRPMPLPALVTLGTTATGAQILVDLEDPGLLSVVGDGAAEVVTAAAMELASGPWSSAVDVVVVGGPEIDGTRASASLEDVIEQLENDARETAALLAAEGCGSTFEARVRMVARDTWVPTVVVCVAPLPDHLARRLLGLVHAAEALGVSALVAGEVPSTHCAEHPVANPGCPACDIPWTMTIGHDGIEVVELGEKVTVPQRVSARVVADVNALLDAAAHAPVPAPAVAHVAPVEGEVGAELVVNLYGPITFEGLAGQISRAKVKEILAFLVCHKGSEIDRDRLIAALWPDKDATKSGGTLTTYMHELRQAVGYASDGVLHVPRNQRLYGVHHSVVTSVELIEAALAAADALDSPAAIEGLRRALDRVEGRPFDTVARSSYEWAHAGNHVHEAARVAGDAAHRLFELCLAAGDIRGAGLALDRGLLADPERELLHQDRIRMAGAERDPLGVDDAMAALEKAAADLDDEPSREAIDLYRREVDEMAFDPDELLAERVG